MVPPLASALSPLSPHALLGRPACYSLREECEELLLSRQGVLCLSISAGSTPLGTASSSFLLHLFVRSFSSLYLAGLLLADLSFVFVKSVYQSVSISPLVGFCLFPFFFFFFGYYLLLPFWVGGAIVS